MHSPDQPGSSSSEETLQSLRTMSPTLGNTILLHFSTRFGGIPPVCFIVPSPVSHFAHPEVVKSARMNSTWRGPRGEYYPRVSHKNLFFVFFREHFNRFEHMTMCDMFQLSSKSDPLASIATKAMNAMTASSGLQTCTFGLMNSMVVYGGHSNPLEYIIMHIRSYSHTHDHTCI